MLDTDCSSSDVADQWYGEVALTTWLKRIALLTIVAVWAVIAVNYFIKQRAESEQIKIEAEGKTSLNGHRNTVWPWRITIS